MHVRRDGHALKRSRLFTPLHSIGVYSAVKRRERVRTSGWVPSLDAFRTLLTKGVAVHRSIWNRCRWRIASRSRAPTLVGHSIYFLSVTAERCGSIGRRAFTPDTSGSRVPQKHLKLPCLPCTTRAHSMAVMALARRAGPEAQRAHTAPSWRNCLDVPKPSIMATYSGHTNLVFQRDRALRCGHQKVLETELRRNLIQPPGV
jgi:hypothetical protein